jgi:hypothetical protein
MVQAELKSSPLGTLWASANFTMQQMAAQCRDYDGSDGLLDPP